MSVLNNPDELIQKLNLIPHPEGGYFSENYRDSKGSISQIYYLLKKGQTSHWHKLKKNEYLHFYDGYPLKILLSSDELNTNEIILGRNLNQNEKFNFTVKANTWFSMFSLGDWSLIGCIVVPAFDYSDFELAASNWKPEK